MHIKTIGKEVTYVGQGMVFPRVVEIRTEEGIETSVPLKFVVVYSEEECRYVLREVTIGDPLAKSEVTGQLIRSVQFQDVLLKGLSQLKFFELNTFQYSKTPALQFRPENRDLIIKNGPTSESLAVVALIYRIAEVLNANQGKHVERVLDIPYATAANWISRARKQGAFESNDESSQFLPAIKEIQTTLKSDSFIS